MTGGQVVSGRFKDVKIFIRSNQDEQDEERVHQMDSSGCVVWECSDWEFLLDLSVLGILSVLVV